MFRVCYEINSSALENHMNSNDDKQSGQLVSHESSIWTAKTGLWKFLKEIKERKTSTRHHVAAQQSPVPFVIIVNL